MYYVYVIINHLSIPINEVSDHLSHNKHASRWDKENFVLSIKSRFTIRVISYFI